MRKSSPVSKSVIYIPVFLLITAGAVILLYSNLSFSTPKTTRSSSPLAQSNPEVKTPQKTSNNGLAACIDESKKELGGLFKVTPAEIMTTSLTSLEEECKESTCTILNRVASKELSTDAFYTQAQTEDACLNLLLNGATKYHLDQIKSRPNFAFFYNPVQSRLDADQIKSMISFLNAEVNPRSDGLLIIGRSSNTSNSSEAKSLTRTRVENLLEQIKLKFSNTVETHYVYFGQNPPHFTFELADELKIPLSAYRNNDPRSKPDPDFFIRLNESILVIPYKIEADPFKTKLLYNN